MRRLDGSVAVAVALAVAVSVLVAAVYGGHPGRLTFELTTPLGLATALAAHSLAARRASIGSLGRQAIAVVALIAVQFAVIAGVLVNQMFVSAHDALFTAIIVVYAGALALLAARLTGNRALDDIGAIRATLAAVGDGRRDVRTNVAGADELAGVAADVDAMVARLDCEERARRTLFAAVSHDLRTPITALRLLSDAIDDEIVDPLTRREYAARMGTHVRALSALIDDLFELTRLESGELTWTMEQVYVNDLVRETVDAMRPQADAQFVSVSAECAAEIGSAARANPERLQRVLFNLIQNAIRHTPRDGSVTVRAERVGDAIEVEVADTGEGIPEADRDRVFEPFHRGDSARTEEGAGLGLAIARAIVEAHGGRIWLADAVDGTSVRFALPA
jgi:signal transduction histidine kinase